MAAIQSATPFLPLSGGSVTGNINISGHIQAGGTTPVAAAGGQAGGTPPAPVVVTGANDQGGAITFGTGTTPVAGAMVQVTFNTPWVIPGGGTPHVVVTAQNALTQALGLFVSGLSPTGFILSCVNAPAASQANTTYSFAFVAMG